MSHFDLCLAWNWEYDAGFVRLLEAACGQAGLSTFMVTPETLAGCLADLQAGEITFSSLFDRASDSDPAFQPLVDLALDRRYFYLNPQVDSRWASDKATMHLEFISGGLDTPYTIVLPPQAEQPALTDLDLAPLGGLFAIKPAVGGGGWGVVLEASSPEQVQAARQQYPLEKMLLQSHVEPCQLDGRPAWFRVLYCDGAVYPCWWDTHTHAYLVLGAYDSARLGLRPLREITRRIAAICRLDLFSTEIALTAAGQFLVVDYVNDPVDLRLQSEAVDGVPDAIVINIAGRLARLAGRHMQRK